MIAFLAFAAFFPKLSPGVASMASWGFLVSGVAQLVIVMIDARRRGLLERLTWPRWTPEIRKFLWMLGPAIGISASYQIGALADQIVGSLLPTGGLSAISYADRLYQLPGGVIVIATGSVLLREMSALVALGDDKGALAAQNRAASLTLALGAPFVVAFLLIPDLIVAVAFEHGAFKANATHGPQPSLQPTRLACQLCSSIESQRRVSCRAAIRQRRSRSRSSGLRLTWRSRSRCFAAWRTRLGPGDGCRPLDQGGRRVRARPPTWLDGAGRTLARHRLGDAVRRRRACACAHSSRRTARRVGGAPAALCARSANSGSDCDRRFRLLCRAGLWPLAHWRRARCSPQAGPARASAGPMTFANPDIRLRPSRAAVDRRAPGPTTSAKRACSSPPSAPMTRGGYREAHSATFAQAPLGHALADARPAKRTSVERLKRVRLARSRRPSSRRPSQRQAAPDPACARRHFPACQNSPCVHSDRGCRSWLHS